VLLQQYENIEYIVIDGGSTDGTVDLIQQYEPLFSEKNYSFKYTSEQDKGIYDAMNKGIKLCSGDLVGIINSDDWYEPKALLTVADTYLSNAESDVFHGVLRNVDTDDVTTSVLGYSASMLKSHMIQHPTCFIKRSIYDTFGLFDTTLRSAADYEFMLRLWTNGCKFKFIESILANFRAGGISVNISSLREDYKIKYKYRLMSYPKFAFFSFYLKLKGEWFQ